MQAPERESSLRRREVLGLSSAALASLAGCTAVTDDLREFGPGRSEPERRVAPDWHPEPGQWPVDGYSYARRNHNPFATPPRSEPTTAWTFDADAGVDVEGLIVVDDAVFVRTDAALVALDASDGSERWRQPRAGPGGVSYVAGRLYDTDRDRVRALTPDGDEVWTTTLDGWYYSVLERDGWVYALSDGVVARLHADTGAVVAEWPLSAYALTTTDGPVYAGMFAMSAYDVEDGAFDRRWYVEYEEEDDYRPYGPLAAAGGRLYRPERSTPASDAPTGRLSAFDATDGEHRWGLTLDRTPAHPAVDGTGVYVGTFNIQTNHLGRDGRFLALSTDGEVRWRYEPGASVGTPVVADGAVYLAPFANDVVPLTAFDAETGDELWQRDLGWVHGLAVAGDTLYARTRGRVLAFRERA